MTERETIRKAWLENRKRGIGASEAAAVLGLSPWSSPVEVWARKKGLAPELEDTVRLRIGRMFEDPIAQIYAEMERVQIVGDGMQTIFHPTLPIFATPDRLVVAENGSTIKGLEIKTVDPFMSREWGEEGTDQIPHHYHIQVAVGMGVTDLPAWDVVAFFGLNDLRIYRVERDRELEEMIFGRLAEFWNRYVVGNEEPPIDGSKSCAEYVSRKYPKSVRPMKEADEETDRLLERLLVVRDEIKTLDGRKEELETRIKQFIEDADGVQGTLARATWRNTKSRNVVDWEQVVKDLFQEIYGAKPTVEQFATLKRIIDARSTTTPGPRRFLLTKAPI